MIVDANRVRRRNRFATRSKDIVTELHQLPRLERKGDSGESRLGTQPEREAERDPVKFLRIKTTTDAPVIDRRKTGSRKLDRATGTVIETRGPCNSTWSGDIPICVRRLPAKSDLARPERTSQTPARTGSRYNAARSMMPELGPLYILDLILRLYIRILEFRDTCKYVNRHVRIRYIIRNAEDKEPTSASDAERRAEMARRRRGYKRASRETSRAQSGERSRTKHLE